MTRAAYAAAPDKSAGRLLPEPSSPTRSDFQRDRDRIIHSTAFRRLAHKTQVFVPHEGDHYRTRLTHSIEVGQLARALARSLALDEDLAEAVALAHDLGHTPFGHTGEEVLDALMAGDGGFDHNAQTLRIVTKLERRYAEFDGLNLTYETLEGLVKHNGPLLKPDGSPILGRRGIPGIFREADEIRSLGLGRHAAAEAQCAALADDIAYNAHDLDDGLRAGLFSLAACREVPYLAMLLEDIVDHHPGLDDNRAVHELTRRLITGFVEDAIAESRARLDGLDSLDAVRDAGARRRRVLARFRGRGTRDQGVPLDAYVPPCGSRRDPRARRIGGARPVPEVPRASEPDAPGMGRRMPARSTIQAGASGWSATISPG